MSTVGWAAVVGFLTSFFGVLRLVFDQVPPLMESLAKAVEAVRATQRKITGRSAKAPSPDDEQEEQP